MAEQIGKNKIVLLGLAALLLVSCGGGGGGSSNTPVIPSNSEKPAVNKVENIVNPSNPGNRTSSNVVPTTNPAQNGSRESLESLRARMTEPEVREHILKEQNNSTESIPMDNKKIDGATQKVAVLDGDFLKRKQYFENLYPGIEVLNKTSNKESNSTHGEIVLKAMREGSKVGIIASSIGMEPEVNGEKIDTVMPTLKDYQNTLNRFSPNQKVKVFSQSWGVPKKIGDFRADNNAIANIAPGGDQAEGQKILDFYKAQVNNDVLFVWANGNTLKGVTFNDAYFQAGLPYLYSELEKGWITVVGVQKKEGSTLNKHYSLSHLAYPGNAKWWSISADAEVTDSKGLHRGSSFAAPRVARVAALIAEKYDWMTADQVRQTLFTTTDRPEINENDTFTRNIISSPDSRYGWGILNQERALKGPGAFINIRRQYEHSPNSNNIFKANVPENRVSYFENDIVGDGGLEKSGKGTLHLTGNNSYERGSIVKEGTLEIHKVHAGQVDIGNNGTLVLHSKAIIGYNTNAYSVIDDSEIKATDIVAKNVNNKGTLKVKGTTAIIGGDYIAHPGSTTEMDISSKVRVLGNINMQGGVALLADRYVAMGEQAVLLEGANAQGSVLNVQIDGMRKANVEIKDGKVVATMLRENTVEYLGENAEASSKNVAENVENVFQDLDRKVLSGTATEQELVMAATLQSMSSSSFSSATELMSGEIYASAQALTFSQAQNINRDLSNRLSGLDNLKNSNENSEVWFSAIGSGGKLKRDGYASADTRVTGGQFGMDTKFGQTTTLGVAMNYSYAKANFNRYAGKSTSDMVGLSLYGKQDLPDA